MAQARILWADDEIDLLKSQITFLKAKGYDVTTATNGHDAVEMSEAEDFDVVLLDESMPGITGLETLERIKANNQLVPVVMITKNEQENLMEEAIGAQISDYLIKPVNPNQVLLTLKKLLDNKRLVSETTSSRYQQEFRQLFVQMQDGLDYEGWVEVYKKLVYWELELDSAGSDEMLEIFDMQKTEANNEFSRFVSSRYEKWFSGKVDAPTMSHTLFDDKVFPNMTDDRPNVLVLIDNMRYDQWRTLQPLLAEYFSIESESLFYASLPTATQYSRNAIFAGLTPHEIARRLPKFWRHDHEDGGKNDFEQELLTDQLTRKRRDNRFYYTKVTNVGHGRDLVANVHNLFDYDLSVIVYNFVDMLSHARTEMEVLKELAGNESAYRSVTRSWFEHSALFEALKTLAEKPINVMVTTDHGTMRVQNPVRVIGDRTTTTNLRYKHGKNLNYKSSEVYEIRKPEAVGLPAPHVSSGYIFARSSDYFVYPNNYNHYANYYRDTFQHGGISLEEMIVPFAVLKSKA